MKKAPAIFEVSIEAYGTSHQGTYAIDTQVITVRSVFGSSSTQLGRLPSETAARMLLREIVTQARERGEW